jgi:uncharacterized membrane protein
VLAAINLHSILVFIHVSAAVVGLGSTFAFALGFPLAVRLGDPRYMPFVHHFSLEVGRKFANPALLVILITGIWQALDADISLGEPWISAAFVIVIVLGALNGAYFIPTDRKLAKLAEDEIASGATKLSESYRRQASREGGIGALTGLLVVVAIFLMVTKPG